MKVFLMIYEHRYGTSVFTFKSEQRWDRKPTGEDMFPSFPDEDDLMRLSDALCADVELDKINSGEESVDITEINIENIPVI